METKMTVKLTSGSFKKLLAGMTAIENCLPYDGDYILTVENVEMDCSPAKYDVFAAKADDERKISSIKDYRGCTGQGLKKAKDAVENCINKRIPMYMGTFISKLEAEKAILTIEAEYTHIMDLYVQPSKEKAGE